MVEVFAVRERPLLLPAARVATGLSFAVHMIANLAEVVESPPTAKS